MLTLLLPSFEKTVLAGYKRPLWEDDCDILWTAGFTRPPIIQGIRLGKVFDFEDRHCFSKVGCINRQYMNWGDTELLLML